MNPTEKKIAALEQALHEQQEYAGIIPLFLSLYRHILENGGATGIVAALLSVDQGAERMKTGFPALSPSDMTVDGPVATAFLRGILAVLKDAGQEAGDELDRIDAELEKGALDLAQLFAAILERRRAPLDETAASLCVQSPLLEYVLEIPLRTSLENAVIEAGFSGFPEWSEGFCPFCGSRAGMAELTGEEGKRTLFCSACSLTWPFKRLKCPYCGNEDVSKLSYFTAGEGPTRVDTCQACSRYIKTRDSRKGNGDVPLEVEDLLTMHLDLLAAREGFERGK